MFFEILSIFFTSQLVFGIILWLRVKDLYKYPNALGTPIIGNLYNYYKHLMFFKQERFYESMLKLQNKLGKKYYFANLLGKTSFVISCPKLIEEIVFNPNISEKPKVIYGMGEIYVHGLFTNSSYDAEYKRRRKEINSCMKPSLIKGPYFQSAITNVEQVFNFIKKDPNNIDIHTLMYIYSLNVAGESIFEQKNFIPWDTLIPNIQLTIKLLSISSAFPIFAYLFTTILLYFDKILFSGINILYKIIDEVLEKVKKNESDGFFEDSKDLPLSRLIALRNMNKDCPIKEIRKEFTELLFVASHTIASNLAAGYTILATLPEIQEKIWEEQNEIFGNSDRDPTVEDISKMEYLDRVINEILRFQGPPYLGKHATADITLDGVIIPKGTNVIILNRPSRMDPRYWKNPKSFDPDHFLKENDRPKFSSLPFGVGVRSCPGQSYGIHQMKVLMSMLSRKYKFSSGHKFEDIEFEATLLDEVKHFYNLRAEERN